MHGVPWSEVGGGRRPALRWFLIALAAVPALARHALAQGEPAAAPAEPTAGELASPEELGFSSTAMAPAPPPPPVASATAWGTRYLDRPRTLPGGKVEGGVYLDYARFEETDAMGTQVASATLLSVAAGVGITDHLELRAAYELGLDPSSSEGPLSIAAAVGLSEGALAIAVQGDFTYDVPSETGGIGVGARLRVMVRPDLGLYTQRQLVMSVLGQDPLPAELHFPLGAGYQVNEQLYLFAETELGQLDLQHSQSLAPLADYLPLAAGLVFAVSPRLELGGALSTDLVNAPADSLAVGAFSRGYL